MVFDWDPQKDQLNRVRHGISFQEATQLFESGDDILEIFDDDHSVDEERFMAVGRIAQGVVVVVFTEPGDGVVRLISARKATKRESRLFWDRIGEYR